MSLKRAAVLSVAGAAVLVTAMPAAVAAAPPSAPAKPGPTITVSPNKNLGFGDTVTVRGKGFTPNTTVLLEVCRKGGALFETGCPTVAFGADADSEGFFETEMQVFRAVQIEGTRFDCAPDRCELVAGDFSATVARAALTFARTPLPPPLKVKATMQKQGIFDPSTGDAQVMIGLSCNRDAFGPLFLDIVQYWGRLIFRSSTFGIADCTKGSSSTTTAIFEPTTGKFGKGKASISGTLLAISAPDIMEFDVAGDVTLEKGTITPPLPGQTRPTSQVPGIVTRWSR